MDNFYSAVESFKPQDKEVFVDDEDIEWTIRADGTGMLASATLANGATVKFTQDHLTLCRAPAGLRRKAQSIQEELSWLTRTMQKATKRMVELQAAVGPK